jgi:hypothetical protein
VPRLSTSKLRIIVTGLIAQHPCLGGVTWDYLQYVTGLARLGHDVYYIEDSGQWPYKLQGGPRREDWIAYDCSPNVGHLADIMARFGLEDRWAYHFPIRPRWFGLSRARREDVLATADLLINVSGTLKRPSDYRQVPRLAYIDSDPAFTQVKLKLRRGQLKFQKRLAVHDVFFSFGERFTDAVPDTGHQWLPTRQPIVLSDWRPQAPCRDVYTTVMSWTSYTPLRYRGRTYGQKDVEFKRFLEMPARVRPVTLEVAIGKTEHLNWETNDASLPQTVLESQVDWTHWTPRELLVRCGWQVVDAMESCADLDSYRRYVESSKGEWSVAKNGYVAGQAGWFSCRSACYLAAGRPVVVQDTGFAGTLPVGEGIMPFTDLEEATAALREVDANYRRHSDAARAIAEEYFGSDKVLTRFIDSALGSHGDTGSPATVGSTLMHRPESGSPTEAKASSDPVKQPAGFAGE